MTTAYEYLEREERRIKMPVISAFAALAASLIVFSLLAYMSFSASRLEKEYSTAAIRMANDAQEFINRATSMLPPENQINELEQSIQLQNLIIGGNFSVWTKLFNTLEEALPEGAIIMAIENPSSGKPLFAAEDRLFRFRVAVTDPEHANSFYIKLSESKAFENLNFTPKGDVKFQGRTGFSIEIEFKFNDAS